MVDRGGNKTILPFQDSTERNGKIRQVKRKTLQRQNASLQTDSSMDRNSGDDGLAKSNGAQPINTMKLNASFGDFQPKSEVLRVLPTSATLAADAETSEVSERSTLTRSRTSATDSVISQPIQPLADDALVLTSKVLDNKLPKSTDKDGSMDPLNAANASTKHRRERFQKWFPDVASTDELLQYYYCAYSREILFPGFLYVTNDWICFHSKIMGKKNLRIPVQSIVEITKERTAKLIPNAIGIVTRQDRYVFASLVSRDRTYSLLMKIWRGKKTHGEEDSLNGSSQNGERNDANDDISGDSDEENMNTGSDESPSYDSLVATGSRNGLTPGDRGDAADATVRRRPAYDSRDHITSHSVTHGGRKSESSGVGDNRHSWRSKLSAPFYSISSTTVILLLTTILILFLIASACLLAFKLIHLQAQMEATLQTESFRSPDSDAIFTESTKLKDGVNEDIYHLKHEQHLSSIQRLHSLLEVHLKLLDKVNQSLKGLRQSTLKSCSTLSADEYVPDLNS